MRLGIVFAFAALAYPVSLSAQISDAAASDDMKPFFAKANNCLSSFDIRAKSKKVGLEIYKAAVDGACTTEIADLRGLYSLSLERSDSQKYLLEQFDSNVRDARAKMVAAYAMR